MTYPQFFWADRCVHRIHEGATMIGIVWIFHFVPPDALKIHSLARSVLRFFVKLFPSYLSLPYQNTPREWFLRSLYFQINKFYDYKLARAAKRSELKRWSRYYCRNHTKDCKLFTSFNEWQQAHKESRFRNYHSHLKSRSYFSQVVEVKLWILVRPF